MKCYAAFFFLFVYLFLGVPLPAQERARCVNSYNNYCSGASSSTNSWGKWIGPFIQSTSLYSSSSGLAWHTERVRGYNLFGFWHGKVTSVTVQHHDTVSIKTEHYRLGKLHGSFQMSWKGKVLLSGRYRNGIRSLQTEYDSLTRFITTQEVIRQNMNQLIRLRKKEHHQEWRTFREGKIHSKRSVTFDFKSGTYVSTNVFYDKRGKEVSYEASKSSWGD